MNCATTITARRRTSIVYSIFCMTMGVGLWAFTGCEPSATVETEHEHAHDDAHEHPETFAAALAEIKERRETVQNAFASGEVGKEGDAALHEIGHLLEELPHLAEEAGLSGEHLTAVKNAADRVFESYSNLDAVIHSDAEIPEGTYDRVAESIDSGIAELEAKLSLVGSEGNHQESGESHESHEEHGEHEAEHEHE